MKKIIRLTESDLRRIVSKVITENNNSKIKNINLYIRDYIDSLSPIEICNYWNVNEGPRYISETLDHLVWSVKNDFPGLEYDEVIEFLSSLGVKDNITEFFYGTISNCSNY
jgi:hypothetical protein